jgi:hypothetical protein
MAIVLDGTNGVTTNSGTLISATTIGVGNATPSTSGAGITFPATQSASSDANTLDDYEEGTWTPIIGGSGGQSGQSYSGQAGYYTKTGRVVTVNFRVVLSTKGTITSDVMIGNLPFTSQNSVFYAGGVTLWDNLATNWNYIYLKVAPNTTYAIVEGTKTAGAGVTTAITSDIGNSSQFNGSFTYFV